MRTSGNHLRAIWQEMPQPNHTNDARPSGLSKIFKKNDRAIRLGVISNECDYGHRTWLNIDGLLRVLTHWSCVLLVLTHRYAHNGHKCYFDILCIPKVNFQVWSYIIILGFRRIPCGQPLICMFTYIWMTSLIMVKSREVSARWFFKLLYEIPNWTEPLVYRQSRDYGYCTSLNMTIMTLKWLSYFVPPWRQSAH